jgi:hypothetical protein
MAEKSGLQRIVPIPEEAKRLQSMIGTWRAEGTLAARGRLFTVHGIARFSTAASGRGLLILNTLQIEGLGEYEEAAIIGFNVDDQRIHFFSLTNTSSANDH